MLQAVHGSGKMPGVLQSEKGDMSLYSVYVPTNHIYVGDVFLMGEVDIIKPNLSVREGLGKHWLLASGLLDPSVYEALLPSQSCLGFHYGCIFYPHWAQPSNNIRQLVATSCYEANLGILLHFSQNPCQVQDGLVS